MLRGVFVGNVSVNDRRPIDELLATLGKELRGPLPPILNSLEILKLSGAFDHGHTKVACSVIEQQVQSLNRLISSLLEVARVTRGALHVVTEPIELTAVVREAVESSRTMIDDRGHDLTLDCDSPAVWVLGDRLRLAQVITSLLHNASKYTNTGGRIEVHVRRGDREVVVRVQDNGIGIAAPMLDGIFDMFVQADSPARRRGGGLGIGLTLARGIVAMHGGTIEAFSDGPGQGSEFIVRLPRLGHWQGGRRS